MNIQELAEAVRDHYGRYLPTMRLRRIVSELDSCDPVEVIEAIHESPDKFCVRMVECLARAERHSLAKRVAALVVQAEDKRAGLVHRVSVPPAELEPDFDVWWTT